jgi:hypothetical protein
MLGAGWDRLSERDFDPPDLFAAYYHTLRWNRVTAIRMVGRLVSADSTPVPSESTGGQTSRPSARPKEDSRNPVTAYSAVPA